MSKFKVGDRVVALSNAKYPFTTPSSKEGNVGYIAGKLFVLEAGGESYGSQHEDDYELVEEKPERLQDLWFDSNGAEWFDSSKEHIKFFKNYYEGNFTPHKPIKKTKKSIMKTLTDNMKRMLNKKHQTLYKTGYLNGDLEYTDKAERALMQHLLKENEEVLVSLGEEEIKKLEEEKKK